MKRIEEIDTNSLLHFEGNPRFESMIYEGLFADIKKHGVLVPLLVAPAENGKYHVIDGERRRKCALELKIPNLSCIVEEMDEKTKWNRAYDLNVLNRPFTPMESARNFYSRMTRFLLTTGDMAGEEDKSEEGINKSSYQFTQARVSQLISLVKLPDETQSLVHQGVLPVEAAYILSQLAFDVNFPKIGRSKSVKDWLKLNEENVWDFSTDKEPLKWQEEREKLQKELANKWINNKITTKNLKSRVDEAVKNEKDRRAWETKQKQELKNEIQKLESEISPAFDLYNESFTEGLAKIIPDAEQRKSSQLSKYFIDKKNLPKDFDDFLYDFTLEINKEMPDDTRMKVIRNARNSTVSFGKQLKRKDPIIFSIRKEPSCPHCGSEVDRKQMDAYFKYADDLLDKMEKKKEIIAQTRDSAVKILRKLDADIKRLTTLKKSLEELKEEEKGEEHE